MPDRVLSLFHNVAYPYPGRRLKYVVAVPDRGRLLCPHAYGKTGWHEARLSDGTRTSIRHYRCGRCGRTVHVYGPGDDLEISRALGRNRTERKTT